MIIKGNQKSKDNLSIIIPAYNEEVNLETAIKTLARIINNIVNDYEIIIVNDGSTDDTGKIADQFARKNNKIKVLHHLKNKGIGAAFRTGIENATKYYVTGFPADYDFSLETYKNLILARKEKHFISSYVTNMADREIKRQVISIFFTRLMNLLFSLKLKYYNGYFISPLSLLKTVILRSNGFTIFAEMKVKLIKKGASFIEIPFETRPRIYGVSKALSLKSIFQTIFFLPVLIKDIYFSKR